MIKNNRPINIQLQVLYLEVLYTTIQHYLKVRTGILAILTPSIRMLPLVIGTMPKSVRKRLDLPLPVLPAIPIFSPGSENKIEFKMCTQAMQINHN